MSKEARTQDAPSPSAEEALEASLLRRVVEAPGDDEARIVFADHLSERGDPRGDFIRLQCAAAAALDERERAELEERASDLLALHERGWSAPARAHLGERGRELDAVVFRRGFVDAVQISGAAVLDEFDHLRALAPVRDVDVRICSIDWANERASGWRYVREELVALRRCDALWSLPSLHVRLGAHDDATAHEVIRTWSTGGQVRELDVATIVESLGAVADTPGLVGLERLRVWARTSADLPRLGAAAHLATIRDLSLLIGKLDGDDAAAFCRRHPTPLRHLEVRHCRLADVRAFVSSPSAAALRELRVRDAVLAPRSLNAIARSPHLSALQEIDLEGTTVPVDELGELFASDRLPCLERLRFSGRRKLGPTLARAIAFGRLDSLKHLSLVDCDVEDGASALMARASTLDNLESLDLRGASLSSAGVAAWIQGRGKHRLRDLRVGRQDNLVAFLDEFSGSELARRLVAFDIGWHHGGDAARWFLEDRMPALRHLKLDIPHVQPSLATALGEHPELRSLELGAISSKECARLADAPFRQLRHLAIGGGTRGCLAALAERPAAFPQLSTLVIGDGLTAEDARRVVETPRLLRLHRLVASTRGRDGAEAILRAAFGHAFTKVAPPTSSWRARRRRDTPREQPSG